MSKRKRKGVKPELLSGVVTGHDDAELERQADALLKSQKAKGIYTEGELRLQEIRVKGLVVKGYDDTAAMRAAEPLLCKLTKRQRVVVRARIRLGSNEAVAVELGVTVRSVQRVLARAGQRIEAALQGRQLDGLRGVLSEVFRKLCVEFKSEEVIDAVPFVAWPREWLEWADEHYHGRV